MCFAQGHSSDASETRTLGLESSTLPLSPCAPLLQGVIPYGMSYDKVSYIDVMPYLGLLCVHKCYKTSPWAKLTVSKILNF